jgi:MHS family proline/betaine transporter-like MFS transporter
LLIGLLVGSAVATLVSMSMSHENLDLWGWRIPFVLSLLGGAVGTYMRKSIDDPKHFKAAQKEADAHVVPLKLLMKKHKKDILRIIAFELTLSVGFYVICVFIMSYLIAFVKMDESQALLHNTISMLVFAATIPCAGWLSDRVGRKPLMMTSSAMFIAFSYYLFLGLFDATQPNLQLACQIGLSMIMGLYFGPLPAFLVEFFPTKIRYSGLSISHNLSMAIFGGTAPFVVTWLIHVMGDTAAPAYYLIAASFISFICLLPLKDNFRDPLK